MTGIILLILFYLIGCYKARVILRREAPELHFTACLFSWLIVLFDYLENDDDDFGNLNFQP